MKNYVKYISLGAATLLLNSYINADVRSELLEANKAFAALKSNPENWKTVAESFINIFDTFNNTLIAIAEENGCKTAQGSFIDAPLWKTNSIVDYYYVVNFLKSEIRAPIDKKRMMPCDRQAQYEKGFKKAEKALKSKIVECLVEKNKKHNKLNIAGEKWEKEFITPVGQLLYTYSKEMNNDVENLKTLLELNRCYRRSETIMHKAPEWNNFKDVNNIFLNALVDTIFTCNASDEKENILYAILTQDDICTIQNKDYFGTGKYAIEIIPLAEKIQNKIIYGGTPQNEVIAKAIVEMQNRAERLRRREQARAEGEALRSGAGF